MLRFSATARKLLLKSKLYIVPFGIFIAVLNAVSQGTVEHFTGTVTEQSFNQTLADAYGISLADLHSLATPAGDTITGSMAVDTGALTLTSQAFNGNTYSGPGTTNSGRLTLVGSLGTSTASGVVNVALSNSQQEVSFGTSIVDSTVSGSPITANFFVFCGEYGSGAAVTAFTDYSLKAFPLTIPQPSAGTTCGALINVFYQPIAGVIVSRMTISLGTITADSTQPPPFKPSPVPKPPTPPTPKPPPVTCSISSQTTALTPGNRSRTRIGVGEQVELSLSFGGGAGASWVTDGRGKLARSMLTPTVMMFTAPDRNEIETVTAVVPDGTCSITFSIVQPSGITMGQYPHTELIHLDGKPVSGFWGQVFVTPSDVNFGNVQVREERATALATGVYSFQNGDEHDTLRPIASLSDDVAEDRGTPLIGWDRVSSGGSKRKPPFTPGYLLWDIPWDFRVATGPWFKGFTTVRHLSTLGSDGVTLTTSKGGFSISMKVTDGTPPYTDPATFR